MVDIIDRSQSQEDRRTSLEVKKIKDMVEEDRVYWAHDFKRIEGNRKFARGLQWQGMSKENLMDEDRPYVANITQRHLKAATAAIYARNPTYVWHERKRLYRRLWDGTAQQLMMAQEAVSMGMDPAGMHQAIIEEAMNAKQEREMLKAIGETLAIVYEYQISEQVHRTKQMMKRLVMTAKTCGYGVVKQGYQRMMESSPEQSRQLADMRQQLDAIMVTISDREAGELEEEDPRIAEMQHMIEAIESSPEVIIREGLTLDYPDPSHILFDKEIQWLPQLVGCGHITQEYYLSVVRVKEVYGKDLGNEWSGYRNADPRNMEGLRGTYVQLMSGDDKHRDDRAKVMEIWDKEKNLTYTICDGYHSFLVEPKAPDIFTERFFPFFIYAPNWGEAPDYVLPPSDVELIEPMQREINRAGEGLRDHRYAARPGWMTQSAMNDKDRMKIENRNAHSLITITSMPDKKIGEEFIPFPTSPIDPNLYNTGPAFQDIQRTTGTQEANYGGTSSGTATEAGIAQASLATTDDSSIDELDDLLTELAHNGGQILMQEMDSSTVREIAGPGAVWPEQDRLSMSRDVFLEVEAGSSGRKNQGQEVGVRQQMYPYMFQIPGLSHEWMAKDMLRIMDPNIRYEDAIDTTSVSIIALNAALQAEQNFGANGNPAREPNAQGGEGSMNAPTPQASAPPGPTGQENAPAA